jgi:hypothetical protein
MDSIFEEALKDLRAIIPQFFNTPLPLFAFIDPFGFKGFRFESVRQLLASPTFEIRVNLGAGFRNIGPVRSRSDLWRDARCTSERLRSPSPITFKISNLPKLLSFLHLTL